MVCWGLASGVQGAGEWCAGGWRVVCWAPMLMLGGGWDGWNVWLESAHNTYPQVPEFGRESILHLGHTLLLMPQVLRRRRRRRRLGLGLVRRVPPLRLHFVELRP